MREVKWIAVIAVLGCVAYALTENSMEPTLLATADRALQQSQLQERRPALSAPLSEVDYWESYNEWSCFSSEALEFTCAVINYEGWRQSPVIVANREGHRFEYDLDPTFNWDCEFTLGEWRRVIADSPEVCLFGAYLQPLEASGSLMVLSQIKSEHGYWKEFESDSYRFARHKLAEEPSAEPQ